MVLEQLYRLWGVRVEVEDRLTSPLPQDIFAYGPRSNLYHKERRNGTIVKVLRTFQPRTVARLQEFHLLVRELEHQNICRLFQFGTLANGQPAVVRSFYDLTLSQVCLSGTQSEVTRIMDEAAAGLLFLHSYGIAHGNFLSDNVLVTDDGHAVICDVGFSHILHSSEEFKRIPSSWRLMAPEVLSPHDLSFCSLINLEGDVWSFGMVLYQALVGDYYYSCRAPAIGIPKIIKCEKPREKSNLFPSNLWPLFEWMTEYYAYDRPSMRIVKHEMGNCV